jgi:hypothetical protein
MPRGGDVPARQGETDLERFDFRRLTLRSRSDPKKLARHASVWSTTSGDIRPVGTMAIICAVPRPAPPSLQDGFHSAALPDTSCLANFQSRFATITGIPIVNVKEPKKTLDYPVDKQWRW